MDLQRQFRRLMHFAAVGLVGTGAHYLLLVALVEGLGADPVLGSVAGFCLGALVNYVMSHRFVFRSDRAHQEALPRFFAVALSGLAWNTLLMVEQQSDLGGSLLYREATIEGVPGKAWAERAELALAERGVTILRRATAFALYDHKVVAIVQK